jgi:alpha-tubulin suppressor-like RCC1 family protein
VAVPTPVPATAGVRFRSVATGPWHNLALTEEGEVHVWTFERAGGPEAPTILEELRGHRVRRVAAGFEHSVALTDHGELFTWCDIEEACEAGDITFKCWGTLSRLSSSAVARGAWRR